MCLWTGHVTSSSLRWPICKMGRKDPPGAVDAFHRCGRAPDMKLPTEGIHTLDISRPTFPLCTSWLLASMPPLELWPHSHGCALLYHLWATQLLFQPLEFPLPHASPGNPSWPPFRTRVRVPSPRMSPLSCFLLLSACLAPGSQVCPICPPYSIL